jgi:hypothetical protein
VKRTSLATWIALLALGAGMPALASPHVHESHAAPARLSFDHGRKWATDDALRRHMGEIRDMLARESSAILAGKLTDERSKAMGLAIEAHVAAIVRDCKLEPEADANLHLIVAELVEAADILQGKSSRHWPDRGATKAVRASQMYATYFDHPGWIPVH